MRRIALPVALLVGLLAMVLTASLVQRSVSLLY